MTSAWPACFRAAVPAMGLALAVAAIDAPAAPGSATVEQAGAEAADAFGRRVGQESVGLYSESLVRGFSPQDAGNFRLEDAYYVRAAAPTDALAASSEVRVGPRALGFDFPSPSGVIQYRLLPGDVPRRELQVGLMDVGTARPRPFARAFGTLTAVQGSLSAAMLAFPDERYFDGAEGRYVGLGLVARWRPHPRFSLATFAQASDWDQSGDFAFVADPGAALPRIPRQRYVGPDEPGARTRDANGGMLAGVEIDARWRLDLSAIGSWTNQPHSSLNVLSELDGRGTARLTTIVARDRWLRSAGYEARLRRSWSSAASRGHALLALRHRDSDYRDPRVAARSLGRVELFAPPSPAPTVPDGPSRRAGIVQHEVGPSLQQAHRSGWAWSAGLRRVELEERVRPPDAPAQRRRSGDWLHDASVTVPLGSSTALFLATTSALEEVGSAPPTARNAFEILPAVEVRQREAGLEWQARSGLRLVATAFDLQRSDVGLDVSGTYGVVGDVQHRGVEVSLSTALPAGWSVLAGMTAMRQRLALVGEASEGPRRPVGRAETLGLLALTWQPAANWTFDAQLNHSGDRPADPANATFSSAVTSLNVGLRHRRTVGAATLELRARVLNVLDEYSWTASASGLQTYSAARRVELTLGSSW